VWRSINSVPAEKAKPVLQATVIIRLNSAKHQRREEGLSLDLHLGQYTLVVNVD
jgi:hypothetical protein